MLWEKVENMPHCRFKTESKIQVLRISPHHINLSYGTGSYPTLEVLSESGWKPLLQVNSKHPGEQEECSQEQCEKRLKEYAKFLYSD